MPSTDPNPASQQSPSAADVAAVRRLLDLLDSNAATGELLEFVGGHPEWARSLCDVAYVRDDGTVTESGQHQSAVSVSMLRRAVKQLGRNAFLLMLLDLCPLDALLHKHLQPENQSPKQDGSPWLLAEATHQAGASRTLMHRWQGQRQRLLWQLIEQERAARHGLQNLTDRLHETHQKLIRDSLTGIYNREFALETLRTEVSRALRYQTPIAVVFADVDHFKQINDNCGHLFGDQALRQVSQTMSNSLRGSDVLARYGGEEFLLLPDDPSREGVCELMERLRIAINRLQLMHNDRPVSVTVSFGAALTTPDQRTRGQAELSASDVITRLLNAADAALYKAKRLGRNRWHFEGLQLT